jgi:hypothetical protein
MSDRNLVANFTSGFGWVIVGIMALIGLVVGWKNGGFLVQSPFCFPCRNFIIKFSGGLAAE